MKANINKINELYFYFVEASGKPRRSQPHKSGAHHNPNLDRHENLRSPLIFIFAVNN
jgi:hypothetical protein